MGDIPFLDCRWGFFGGTGPSQMHIDLEKLFTKIFSLNQFEEKLMASLNFLWLT
jgi:hypothetical protein